jgi:hypothetical protein
VYGFFFSRLRLFELFLDGGVTTVVFAEDNEGFEKASRGWKGYDRCQWREEAASLKLCRRASPCLSLLDMPAIGTFPQDPEESNSRRSGVA